MRSPCIDCARCFPGLNYVIPDEDWRAAVGRLDAGEVCPECIDKRLRAVGRSVKARISWSLGNLQAFDMGVFVQLEALDGRVMQEKAIP